MCLAFREGTRYTKWSRISLIKVKQFDLTRRHNRFFVSVSIQSYWDDTRTCPTVGGYSIRWTWNREVEKKKKKKRLSSCQRLSRARSHALHYVRAAGVGPAVHGRRGRRERVRELMALGGERRVDGLSGQLVHVERRVDGLSSELVHVERRGRRRPRDGRRTHLLLLLLLAVDHAAAAVGRVTALSEHGPGLGIRDGTRRGPVARGSAVGAPRLLLSRSVRAVADQRQRRTRRSVCPSASRNAVETPLRSDGHRRRGRRCARVGRSGDAREHATTKKSVENLGQTITVIVTVGRVPL